MLANTPKLGLPQWEPSDDFDVLEVNAALLKIENKLCPPSVTTAQRPTGVNVYDGMVVYDTDIGKYIMWVATGNSWRSVEFGGVQSPTIAFTVSSNYVLLNKYFAHKSGVAQLYINVNNNLAIPAGNVGNAYVCKITDPTWYPITYVSMTSGATGPIVNGLLDANGQVTLAATATLIPANTDFSLCCTYLLK